ncbi:MAG TPA: sodium-translocating pyrophosphatase [archaeon]|nr:sodium-translocating pyrophosphatase [archaeon]
MVLEYVAGAGILGLLVAGYKARQVLREEEGSKKMIEISSAIREGAMAYLKKQYSILAIFVLIVALFIFLPQGLNQPSTAVSFILGAFLSVLSGFIGMYIATRANVRTTNAARKGLNEALKISFSAGLVMAFFASSVGLLGIVLLYSVFGSPESIFGFAFGASSVALFARVGGGIFTKAADVGADLVGKLEKHIPEDDPRNPAVIADNVGDNVGDVAGMGADLFESYVGSIIAAMAIGLVVYTNTMNGLLFPLVLVSVGLIASLIGTFIVRVDKSQNVTSSFQRGLLLASILVAVGSYFVVTDFFGEKNLFYVVITGLATGLLIGMNTDRYTSDSSKYTRSIVEAAKTGVAPTILQGFVVGMKSTKNTLLIIGLAILVSFVLGGVYGISIAAVAMLSTLGISLAIDAFGPVVDNAGGIAEMSNLPAKVRAVTDKLDAAGNTTAAIGKGFAIGSAALTALALFWAYANQAGLTSINVIDAKILVGLFVGGMLPFYFSALTTQSVGTTAMAMVEEVRRQFKSIKGLMEGKAKPDYKRCVEISTENALREMILPGVLAVAIPVLVGWLFGAATLAGLLVGALITGASLANLLSNSGGAWDNAKKYVEAHKKNTVEWNRIHDATVVGDTVGDPFKDTSGPALNILIKLMTIVSVIALPLFLNPVFVI